MKICIGPVQLIDRIHFAKITQENPGIGGSEHYFLYLAHRLSLMRKGLTVTVLFNGKPPSLAGYNNPLINFAPLAEMSSLQDWDVAILGTAFLAKEANPRTLPKRVIAVSHHPHDGHLKQLLGKKKPFAVVNLGRYQFLSNSKRGDNHFRIPSFFVGGEALSQESAIRDPKLVGHISSMHPSKGFHVVARQWRRVLRKNKGAKLEVLGGASLYGQHENHPLLPTTLAYGEKIVNILGSDLQNGTVKFLGRVPGTIDSIVRRWTVALINPKGIGEADPATLRDLIRLGVPVVSSRKYGLSEYMDYFPETTVKHAWSIPSTLKRFFDSHELQIELTTRSRNLADSLLERNKVIEKAWAELLFLNGTERSAGDDWNLLSLHPKPPPFYERITIIRNDLHARAFRFLERIYSIIR